MLLMDIGGWTVGLMRLVNGIPNASACRSLELGMIRCIDEAKEQVRRETGLSVTDAQVEHVLARQTKSVSRFARNILDCIHHVRLLKSWEIPVIFEKEGIDASDMNSEMILTCLSAFAQAESESIRSNITKGIRMGYRQGRFSFRYVNFLGYRKGADGQPEIHPEEALHHAILEAIRSLIQNRQKDMAANLENALLDSLSDNLDELSPEAVKNKLKKIETGI